LPVPRSKPPSRSEDDLFALLKDATTPPAFPPPVELALA